MRLCFAIINHFQERHMHCSKAQPEQTAIKSTPRRCVAMKLRSHCWWPTLFDRKRTRKQDKETSHCSTSYDTHPKSAILMLFTDQNRRIQPEQRSSTRLLHRKFVTLTEAYHVGSQVWPDYTGLFLLQGAGSSTFASMHSPLQRHRLESCLSSITLLSTTREHLQ